MSLKSKISIAKTKKKRPLKARGKKASARRKKVADVRMSEPSTRGDGTYTPTIRVGGETPLTIGMDGKFSWGVYKPKGANTNRK